MKIKPLKKILSFGMLSAVLSFASAPELGTSTSQNNSTSAETEIVGEKENSLEELLSGEFSMLRERIEKLRIPVLMFHKIGGKEDRYTVSPRNFRKILGTLYSNDFYSVALEQFVKGDFSEVPVGKKPVLITFDDADESQFFYDKNADVPSRNSAVGIVNEFYASNPDFGKGGVFFISHASDAHEYRVPFGERNKVRDKFSFLIKNGYNLGMHTPLHTGNKNASIKDLEMQADIDEALIYYHMKGQGFEEMIKTYAYPFGEIPKNERAKEYLLGRYDAVFEAWGGSARHPFSRVFDAKSIPRIETHTSNIQGIISSSSNYSVSFLDKILYERLFPKLERDFKNEPSFEKQDSGFDIKPFVYRPRYSMP